MSFKSRRTLVSLFVTAFLIVAYFLYANSPGHPEPHDLSGWARSVLIFMAIMIVSQIVVHILFHLFTVFAAAARQPKGDAASLEAELANMMRDDEKDVAIEARSRSASFLFAGVGMIGLLAALAMKWSPVGAIHILLAGFVLGGIVEGIVKIFYYERGIRRG